MSNRKEFKWANVQTNGTAKNFGGWDAGGNPVEIPPASSGDITTGTDDQKPVTAATLTAYIAALLASETVKGIVEEATDAEVLAGTATGGTGAKLFVSPAKLENKRSIKSTSISNAVSGAISVDCLSKQEICVVFANTVTGAITLTLTNSTNLEILNLIIPITGANIAITMPSTTRMARYNEVASGDGWIEATKVLQVSSVGTADLHELSFKKAGSVFILHYDGSVRA